ncbi:hypothetical protein T08_954 [Trichinella sp. T8]|nr:hypothetical protein T08_954 [Trichinella sp. T8]
MKITTLTKEFTSAYSSINNNGIYFRVHFLFIAVQSRKPYPSEFQQTKNLSCTMISDI